MENGITIPISILGIKNPGESRVSRETTRK